MFIVQHVGSKKGARGKHTMKTEIKTNNVFVIQAPKNLLWIALLQHKREISLISEHNAMENIKAELGSLNKRRGWLTKTDKQSGTLVESVHSLLFNSSDWQ